MIAEQLHRVQARIDAACQAAARPARSVQLLAVSKTFGVEAVIEALLAGQPCFGENYLQEGVAKIRALAAWHAAQPAGQVPALPQWHCIGPVQSNKSRLVAEHFDWLHMLDRPALAERLNAQRPAGLAPLQVCIQVNVDGGANKSGVVPEQALALARVVLALPRLQLRGLMSIPEPEPDPQRQHRVLARVQQVLQDLNQALLHQVRLDTLSLGMSADLEAAIAAGSTMVRVGTAIFGRRG